MLSTFDVLMGLGRVMCMRLRSWYSVSSSLLSNAAPSVELGLSGNRSISMARLKIVQWDPYSLNDSYIALVRDCIFSGEKKVYPLMSALP